MPKPASSATRPPPRASASGLSSRAANRGNRALRPARPAQPAAQAGWRRDRWAGKAQRRPEVPRRRRSSRSATRVAHAARTAQPEPADAGAAAEGGAVRSRAPVLAAGPAAAAAGAGSGAEPGGLAGTATDRRRWPAQRRRHRAAPGALALAAGSRPSFAARRRSSRRSARLRVAVHSASRAWRGLRSSVAALPAFAAPGPERELVRRGGGRACGPGLGLHGAHGWRQTAFPSTAGTAPARRWR